eukprot:14972980-Alexandrium_andersonii.AAC.1
MHTPHAVTRTIVEGLWQNRAFLRVCIACAFVVCCALRPPELSGALLESLEPSETFQGSPRLSGAI